MEIRTTKSDLLNSLRIVSATTSQSSIDQPAFSGDLSSYYVFRKKDRVVELFSYSGPLISKSVLVCDTDNDDNCFALESRRLNKWSSSVSDGPVTISVLNNGIRLSSVDGVVKFPLVSTREYPWWDDMLEESKLICRIDPKKLDKALDYAKLFISRDDKRPDLNNCEFREFNNKTMLISTNLKGVSSIHMPELSGSKSRISGRDIPSIRKFLSQSKEDVSVMENDSCFFVIGDCGSVIGSMRPSDRIPSMALNSPYENSPIFISFNKDNLVQIANILLSSAPDDNKRVTLNIISDTEVIVSMPSISGPDSNISMQLGDTVVKDSKIGFPFTLSLKYDLLLDVIRKIDLKELVMAIKPIQSGGYVAFMEKSNDEEYMFMIGWDVQ